jgi:hypothetical protein
MIVNSREEFLTEIRKRITQDPRCLEIGVYKGHFSEMIKQSLRPSKLFLVDPWTVGADKNGKIERYENETCLPTAYSSTEDLDLIKQKFGQEIIDGKIEINRNYSYDAIDSFEDESLDFIYIDACHLYDSVLWDLENYLPKLKEGGVISGHDYVDYPVFGVIEAVKDFCTKHGYEISLLNKNGGDWALSKI